MKKLILILILTMFACKEMPEKEKVCAKVYIIDGRNYETSFILNKNRGDILIYTYRGSYYLSYYPYKGLPDKKHLKAGVVDFKIIDCPDQ